MAFYGNLSGATGRSSGSEEAKGIKYTDTQSIGGTNVQAVLDILSDKVLHRLLTKEEAVQVIDALDNTSTTAALSANQGHELYQKWLNNWGLIVGVQSRLGDAEENITSLQNVSSSHYQDVIANTNAITNLQVAVDNIKSVVDDLPENIAGLSSSKLSDVSGSDFNIGYYSEYAITKANEIVIPGGFFRPRGSITLTETPQPLANIENVTANDVFVNSTSVFIPGSNVVATIDGTYDNTSNTVNLTIKSASGSISISNYNVIIIPCIDIFLL